MSSPTVSSSSSSSGLLPGKVGLITGASDGIGRATAFDWAKEGISSLFLFSRSQEKLEKVQKELKDQFPKVNVEIYSGDVASEEANKEAVDNLVKKFGGLHAVFLNAGIFKSAGTLDKTDGKILDELININIKGVLWGLKYTIPAILSTSEKEKKFVGSIVVNSSIVSHEYGKEFTPGNGIYAATKSFVDGIMKTAALEQGGKIRVNCINPGSVLTGAVKPYFTDEQFDKLAGSLNLIGRAAHSNEIAPLVSFLVSEKASYITGATYDIDGGAAVN